jgi:hypothetical protein
MEKALGIVPDIAPDVATCYCYMKWDVPKNRTFTVVNP